MASTLRGVVQVMVRAAGRPAAAREGLLATRPAAAAGLGCTPAPALAPRSYSTTNKWTRTQQRVEFDELGLPLEFAEEAEAAENDGKDDDEDPVVYDGDGFARPEEELQEELANFIAASRVKRTPLEELDYVCGAHPDLDFEMPADAEDFYFVFERTALARMGVSLVGAEVVGHVTSKDELGLFVEFGGKFPARVRFKRQRWSNKKNFETARRDPATMVEMGDAVVIQIKDTERSEHMQGDSKPVTIHRAIGSFVNAL